MVSLQPLGTSLTGGLKLGGGAALHSLKVVLRGDGLDERTDTAIEDAVYVVDR